MAFIVTDDTLARIDLSAEEVLLDFACFLYEKRKLTIGRASKLANLDLVSFQKELAKRDIYLNYTQNDVDIELRNLGLS